MKRLTFWIVFGLAGAMAPGEVVRVSVATGGSQGTGRSQAPAISADGRCIAFQSLAANLVGGDTNNASDIFVHDRQTGQTSRVSISGTGTQVTDDSFSPSISADGRFVAFASRARTLVSNDDNKACDIFLRDRQLGTTTRISATASGGWPNGDSWAPAISADGRFIAFHSFASNIVTGDTNLVADVFVHDRQTGSTSRVSLGPAGAQGNDQSLNPSISADGRFVAFHANASNLVSGDNNASWDIFRHDRQTGQTIRVSTTATGGEANGDSGAPAISADGRYVAFASRAGNLLAEDPNLDMDIFVKDCLTGEILLVSSAPAGVPSNGDAGAPAISPDARWIVFHTWADNLAAGDLNGRWDVFRFDRLGQTLTLVSRSPGAVPGNHDSMQPSVSGDGQHIAFYSLAADLVPGDTNQTADVFVALSPTAPPGDIDQSGQVDSADLLLLAGFLAGNLGVSEGLLFAVADLDFNASIDSNDLALLTNLLLGRN